MSFLGDIGGWISDNASSAFDWVGNTLTSSGGNETPSSGGNKSFWDQVFTGENIVGAIQGGASILMADQKREEAQELYDRQTADARAVDERNFEQAKELAMLQASLAKGGGGGPDPRRERYLARLDALKSRMVQRGNDSRQVSDAMQSLAQITSGRLLGG